MICFPELTDEVMLGLHHTDPPGEEPCEPHSPSHLKKQAEFYFLPHENSSCVGRKQSNGISKHLGGNDQLQ